MNGQCNLSVVVDPFAVLTFISMIIYLFVEDDRYRVRIKKLIEIKEKVDSLVNKEEKTE